MSQHPQSAKIWELDTDHALSVEIRVEDYYYAAGNYITIRDNENGVVMVARSAAEELIEILQEALDA